MQIMRLFDIVYCLLGERSVTASQLARRFEVSTRTIYRDIDTLCQAGIPIYATKGKGGGIHLMDALVMDRSLLTQREQQDVLTALQGLGAAHYPDTRQVLTKLSGIFGAVPHSWIAVDFTTWSRDQQDLFAILKEAVLQNRPVSFDYYGANGQFSRRTAEPLQLWSKGGRWYLKAYCRSREDYRLFKLSRIHKPKLLEEHFQPKPLPKLQPPTPSGQEVALRLYIHSSLSYRVYDEFEPEHIHPQNDGGFVVTPTFIDSPWVDGFILSFGALAEVLEPPCIRERIRSRIREMDAVYKNSR